MSDVIDTFTYTVGSIPANVTWTLGSDPLLWANTANFTHTTNSWEIEVNFDE
jgi:hypothetical protein